MPEGGRSEIEVAAPEPAAPGRVLLIIGSANTTTEKQLGRLLALRPVVTIEPGVVLSRVLNGDSHILLRVKPGIEVELLASTLASFVPMLGRELRGLVLSGGDTAEAVAHSLRASGIQLGGEIAPGVRWGRIIGGAAEGVAVATKAGGFGAEDSLVRAVDFLA
jgi:uncharacterized protein YgbK (DUF1537 family)